MKNNFWYSFFKVTLGPLFMFWYPAKIYNKENLKVEGPIIVACNHKHIYDQCFTVIYCKRMIRYMAKKEYFDSKKTRWFFKLIGAIPVDRSKKDEDAKKQELASIQNDLMELEKESTDEIEVEYMQDLLKEKQTEKLAK